MCCFLQNQQVLALFCYQNITKKLKFSLLLFRFDLVSKTVLEYNDLLKSNKYEDNAKLYMKKDNVGIVATLQPKLEDQSTSTSNGRSSSRESMRRVVVATTHLYWDPKFAFVKDAQARMLIDTVNEVLSTDGSDILYI